MRNISNLWFCKKSHTFVELHADSDLISRILKVFLKRCETININILVNTEGVDIF